MTPAEKAAALAEAKTRGLPDGWRVELDVRFNTLLNNAFLNLRKRQTPFSLELSMVFFLFRQRPNCRISNDGQILSTAGKIDCNYNCWWWINWRCSSLAQKYDNMLYPTLLVGQYVLKNVKMTIENSEETETTKMDRPQ